MAMCWQPEFESLPREKLEALQLTRLQQTMGQAAKSPHYGALFQQLGICGKDITDISQVRQLPFTTKEDLRGSYPYGFLAVSRDEPIRLHCSSGTTGNPTVIFHTPHDLASWANLVARSLYCAGARPEHVFQNICGYGLFTGGLGFQYGAERLGMLTIPSGAGKQSAADQADAGFRHQRGPCHPKLPRETP